ncbi:unnamed protein product [Moneuplotes crassus]|uniref:Prolyl endopeptidase n=1 Tax=Euplotes crassus TaxID=5936 RepID=A0AAD2D9L8_EUPCR|nr:unnamed protein product [Moneuplotes crassus]
MSLRGIKGGYSRFFRALSQTVKTSQNSPEEVAPNFPLRDLNRFDGYHKIKSDKAWQKRIIKREQDIYKNWRQLLHPQFSAWKRDIFKRTESAVNSIPEQYGDYFYFSESQRYQGSEPYTVFYRLHVKTGEREKVLDLKDIPNITDPSSVIFDKIKISDDHTKLAFTVDLENNERFSTGIIDIFSSNLINWVDNACQAEFDSTGDFLYYCIADSLNRPYKIMKRNLKSKFLKDKVIVEDHDDTHYLEIGLSKDKKYFIYTDGQGSSTVISRQESSEDALISLAEGATGNRLFVDHIRDYFLLINYSADTQEGVKIYKLKDEDMDKGPSAWQTFIEPPQEQSIEDFDAFHDFIAVYLSNGMESNCEILILDLNTKEINTINVDDSIGEITPAINQNYNESRLRFTFTSPLVYDDLYEYDHKTKDVRLLQSNQLRGPEIVKKRFVTKRVEVPAHDGESIPMTVIHSSDIRFDRTNKTIINGYGAYGLNLDLGFNIGNITAAEKGWVVAMAHVRGGSDKGPNWHLDGKLMNKMNSIYDFLSCTEYLIAKGYTHPNLLAARGESAGGMLVAHALNLRPEYYRAAILKVPFLDVVNTLKDTSLPLTLTDYLEFGNPFEDEELFKLISSYSPYENLKKVEYPGIYLDISIDDPRVPSWGSLKYLEKLRDISLTPLRIPDFGNKNIFTSISSEQGHFGSTSNTENLEKLVLEYAFLDFMMFEKEIKST